MDNNKLESNDRIKGTKINKTNIFCLKRLIAFLYLRQKLNENKRENTNKKERLHREYNQE